MMKTFFRSCGGCLSCGLAGDALNARKWRRTAAGPQLDEALNQAVQEQLIPGAVLIVGHSGQIVYRKAYGYRSLIPHKETMTLDTIFDAASLTKVVATTALHHEAVSGRQDPDGRSGHEVSAGIPGRPQRNHRSQPDDAFFRACGPI